MTETAETRLIIVTVDPLRALMTAANIINNYGVDLDNLVLLSVHSHIL
jgi:hypothetical protein